MDRDEALRQLEQVVSDLSGSRLPLATSIALALSPIRAALSSPCACGGAKVLAETDADALLLTRGRYRLYLLGLNIEIGSIPELTEIHGELIRVRVIVLKEKP